MTEQARTEPPERRKADRRHRRDVRLLKVAYVILTIAVAGAFFGYQKLGEQRRMDRTEQIAQLCEAIPNAAAAGAQALIDIVAADARRRGAPAAQITETRRLGALYVARARYLALRDLTTCPKETP